MGNMEVQGIMSLQARAPTVPAPVEVSVRCAVVVWPPLWGRV